MIEITTVNHKESQSELIDLFNVSFMLETSEQYWDWKYLLNPISESNPEVVVAIENGNIIGARPVMIFEMWVNKKKVKVAQPCDTMVHPDYRRHGIFSQMLEFSINHYQDKEYAFFYNFPNNSSCPGYLKHGWRIIGDREPLFFPINAEKLISRSIHNETLVKVGSYFYKKFSGSVPRIKKNKFQIESYIKYNDKIGRIEEFVDQSKINLVRNSDFYKWRLDQHPNHSYKYLVAEQDDEVYGYAVISKQITATGIIQGKIIDYIIKDEDIDCFRELVVKSVIELSDCDIVSILAFNKTKYRRELLSNLNFKSTQNFPYNRIRGEDSNFVARKLDSNKTEPIDIYDKDNWQPTLLYFDST